MTVPWNSSKIMKNPWDIGYRPDENIVSFFKIPHKISNQTSEVLLLGPIIKRENNNIGCNKEIWLKEMILEAFNLFS